MTCADFHGYLKNMSAVEVQGQVSDSLQDTAPVYAKDEDAKASGIQKQTDPVKVEEELPSEPLTVQHTEGRRICQQRSVNDYDTLKCALGLLTVEQIPGKNASGVYCDQEIETLSPSALALR